MTKTPTDTGMNRTGAAMSPIDSKKMQDGNGHAQVPNDPNIERIADVRKAYSRNAEPLGTMPPPGNIKGAVRTAAGAMKGEKLSVFLDLLGERLAFERTGTRLYEALAAKLSAADVYPDGPRAADLKRIRDEEQAHFVMLVAALESLGGDPTAMTPSADVTAVASQGLLQVLADPRTTLTEALKTMLTAELTDNDAWQALVEYAEALGQDELANKFATALMQEQEHLADLRAWTRSAIGGQLGVELPPRPVERGAPLF